MKNKIIALLLAAAGFVLAAVPPAYAQYPIPGQKPTPISTAVSADDTDVALLIKYVGGTATSADVAVAANGDITLRVTAAVDTAIGCPTAGTGIIDVSDAACDTMGEVVDRINQQGTNWRAVLLDSMRADSSNDTILTIAATEATVTGGLALRIDTDVAFKNSRALVPCRLIECYINPSGPLPRPGLHQNPWAGLQSLLYVMNSTSTYASGTSQMQIWSVRATNRGDAGAEVATQLYGVAAGATTVNKVLDFVGAFGLGILGNRDEKMIVRVNNSAAMASVALYAYGVQFTYLP